jgi:hypothetical protein
MLLLFTVVIFVSSSLVFLIQPLFARMVLPVLGGSPAVWNTAIFFYQAVLLLAYLYVHLTTRYLGEKKQSLLHALVLLLPLIVLPLGLPDGWLPPTDSNPAFWLVGLFAYAIGLPYFVVSTSSPLLQRYFAVIGHRDSVDPYFLYAASNVGSILALLLYPFVLEPLLNTGEQAWVWTVGYGLLMVLFWIVVSQVGRARLKDFEPPVPSSKAPTWKTRGRWVLLAKVPSSLMLSVTTYISTDLAATPLLWVIPLSLYLLSFIFAFSRRTSSWIPWFQRAFPIAMVALVMVLAMGSTQPIALLVPLHLVVFFVIAMACHGQVARERPAAEHLTSYYLWMAVGGVLGGLLNAFIAPQIFNSVVEYPLMLVVGTLLVPPLVVGRKRGWFDLAGPVGLGLAMALLIVLMDFVGLAATPPGLLICFGLPTFAAYFFSRRPASFALALALILGASLFYGEKQNELVAHRSFFGIHRVSYDPQTHRHQLAHGNTLHGQQSLHPELARIPQAYYHPGGPVGEVVRTYAAANDSRVGAVGLGAGALAAYVRSGQQWTFFEIDPVVARIATDPNYFTYISDAPEPIRIVLGDARLTLSKEPQAAFHLLVLDAYSSDAIPMHLATQEALALYASRLAPGGVMVFHLSNQHLNLVPILAATANSLQLVSFERHDQSVSEQEALEGKEASRWLVMARDQETLKPLLAGNRWWPAPYNNETPIWTDESNSILDALVW